MQSDKHYTCNYGSLPRWYIIQQIFQLVSVAEHATLIPVSHTQKTGLLMVVITDQVVHWLKSNRNSLNLVYPQSTSRMARYLGWIQGLAKSIDIFLMIIELTLILPRLFYLKMLSVHCIC